MRFRIAYQGKEQEVELTQSEVVIGRPGDTLKVDLDLRPDQRVSRPHARLRSDGRGGYLIEDLGSKYGTWVEGRNIADRGAVPLRPGVPVQMGDTQITLLAPAAGVLDGMPDSKYDPQATLVTPAAGELVMRVQAEGVFNYSLAHIGLPLLSEVSLVNHTGTAVPGGKLRLFLTGYGESAAIPVGPLPAGGSETLPTVPRLAFDHPALKGLVEPEQTKLTATLDGRPVRVEPPIEVTLLPPNAWHALPHERALAAFVMPECAAIKDVVRLGGRQLERLLGPGQTFIGALELDELESSDPRPFEYSLEALYLTLVEWYRIEYAYEPVHRYALNWQAVRFHWEVLRDLKGTCIDLAVLFAACLEAVHRDPLVLLVQTGPNLQHALVACWRKSSPLMDSDPIVRDAAQVRQWVTTDKLLVLNSVGFALSPDPKAPERTIWETFKEARESGLDYLRQYPLRYGIDIAAAREAKIAPMPFGQGVQLDRPAAFAVHRARQEAKRLGSPVLGIAHLLLGLLAVPEGLLGRVLELCRREAVEEVDRLTRTMIGSREPRRHPLPESDNWRRLLGRVQTQAEQRGGWLVTEDDFIQALLEISPSRLDEIWRKADLSPTDCLKHLAELTGKGARASRYGSQYGP